MDEEDDGPRLSRAPKMRGPILTSVSHRVQTSVPCSATFWDPVLRFL